MKNLNLLNRLLSNSHEKQSPQRFGRYAVMLLMLLTLGVGQVWAGSHTFAAGTTIYYDFTAVSGGGNYSTNSFKNYDGDYQTYDASLGGKLIAVTYAAAFTVYEDQYLFKTATGSWTGVKYTKFPSSGQNVIKVGSDGKSYSWGTAEIAITGTMNNWSTTSDRSTTGSISITLAAHKTYRFKMVYKGQGGDKLCGMSSTWITSSVSNYTCTYNGGSDIYITTAGAGTYTFAYDLKTNNLSVTYPSVTHPSADYVYLQDYSWSNTYVQLWSSAASEAVTGYPGQKLYSTSKTTIGGTSYYFAAAGDYGNLQFSDGSGNNSGTLTTSFGKYARYSSGWGWGTWNFTVTLTNNGADTYPSNPSVQFNGTAPTALTAPTKLGYDFGGYWSNSTCDGTKVINADGTWVASASGYTDGSKKWIHEGGTATLYAKWTLHTYNITYHQNGGSGASNSTYNITSSTITLPDGNDMSKDGYNFAGWYDNEDLEGDAITSIPNGSTGNKEFWAKWVDATVYYSVTTGAVGHGSIAADPDDASLVAGTDIEFTAAPDDYYEVEAWYTNSDCDEGRHNAGATTYNLVGLDDDITVYVKFQPITYSITYYLNGGTNSGSNPATYNYESSTITLQDPSKTGYTFVGWYKESTFVNKVTSIASGSNGNKSLYAKWTENMTTVTLTASPANSGTFTVGGAAATSTTAGVTTTRSVKAVPQPGYRVNTSSTVWSKDNNYITLSSTTTNPTTVTGTGTTGNTTALTATFTRTYAFIEGRFHVTNASRNGTWTNTFSEGDWDEGSTRIPFSYDNTNHRFYLHTYATPQELTTQISSLNPYFYVKTSTADGSLTGVTSYMCTSSQTLTTAGSANGKTLSSSSGSNNNLRFNSSTTSGYAVIYFDQSKIWYELEQRLQYNGNGNTGGSAPTGATGNNTYYATGTNATAASNSYTKTNYSFAGWNTNQYITGTNYAAGATNVTMSADVTLYAKWTRSVTLNQNGATTDGSTSVTATYNCATIPSITAPSKTGYTFGGWNTANDGSGSDVINSTGTLQNSKSGWTDGSHRFTRTADGATLYAKWSQDITLNYNASYHGSGSNKSATVLLNATALSSITHTSAATGYELEGYYTAASGGTKILTSTGAFAGNNITVDAVAYTSSGKWVKAGATTLYAHYTPIEYTVTLNAGTGGSGSGTMTVDYDATAYKTWSHTITQTGYSISGWYDNAQSLKVLEPAGAFVAGDVTGYISDGKWCKAANCELQAWWTPNPYAVTFDATTNGGTISGTSPKNVIFDETSVAECPTATKDGYCFDGWYTKASSGQKVINADGTLVASVTDESQYTGAGGAWKKASATTVYAVYVAPEITITADPATLNAGRAQILGRDTVVFHPTFSCDPTGDYNISYTVGYSANHTLLPSQPTIKYGTGAGVGYDTIKMPHDPNTYEVVAILKTGTTRGSGTEVRRDTIDYVVENSYTVNIHYLVDGVDISEARSTIAYPSSAMTTIIVDEVVNGYILDRWELGAGIDTVSGRGTVTPHPEYGYTSVSKMIYAANNGTIKLHYKSKAKTVYFFDAFDRDWYSTMMRCYDYGTEGYWDENGSGSKTKDSLKFGWSTYDESFYYSKTAFAGTTTKLAFTSEIQYNEQNFSGVDVIYRTDFNEATPMFVPVRRSLDDHFTYNTNAHYFRGFWVKASPVRDSTGYYLHVYDGTDKSSAKLIQTLPLRLTKTGEGGSWELTATMDLEGGKTYGFKFTKATGASTKEWYTDGNNGTMTSASDGMHTAWDFQVKDANNCGLATTAAGNYTFHVFCKPYASASETNVQGHWAVTVDYSTLANDYRLLYSDAVKTEPIASQTIKKNAGAKDTVSFFVRKPASSPVMKIQKFNGSTWTDSATVSLTGITKDSVYVFYVEQSEETGELSVTGHDYYDGDFYIRTDCVDEHKWDYKQSLANHRMSPTDYGQADIQPFKFTHYYPHWVDAGGNVKFVVANKYAPCVSDTLITDTYADQAGGSLGAKGASVRFMYNKGTNEIKRDYLAGAEGELLDANFLKITTTTSKMGTTAATPGVITTKTFTDEKNWIYQAAIKAKPGLTAKLTAEYNGNTQYFLGSESEEATILGGTGDNWQQFLLTYDFKQNRLICAWQPSGDSINGDVPINADVMIIREAQGDAQQIIFKNNDSKLSSVKYIYGVMQFNRDDMVGRMSRWDYWTYQLCMYYISFPFDVAVNDIMAPGKIGQEWRLQRYNGAKRAEGWFAGDGVTTFWEDVQAGDTLKAYEGYSLLLNRRIFNDGASSVWQNKKAGDKLYMYFPSLNATTGVVANETIDVVVPEHLCTIDRIFDQDFGKLNPRNHKVVDSHWNMIGTPLFEDKVAATVTTGPVVEEGSDPLAYIYEWNPAGNVLTVAATLDNRFEFKTMYSYMAQYAGTITFIGAAVENKNNVAARRLPDTRHLTMELELSKDDQFVGRTYIELRENAVDTFALNEDMCMLKNGVTADVYTKVGAYEASANVLTIANHTIPVEVEVKTAGTYTFSMPRDFSGTVTLVDMYTQIRTNLSLDEYVVYLEQGTIADRFFIELDVQQTITSLENIDGNNGINDGGVHKFIQNDQMYILKNGIIYDARGARVQ